MPQRRSQNLNGKSSKGRSGRKIGGDGSALMGPGGKGKKAQPKGSRGGHGAFNTDGYPPQKGGAEYEADIFGGHTYYRESDGQTYHGQEAIDMYEQDHPGEGGPHDGITGEAGFYGGWNPSEGGGGGQGDEMEDDDRWGAGQSRPWSR